MYNLVDYLFGNKRTPISLGLKVQARLNGVNLFWGVFALGLTFLGYRTAYVPMILLLISLICNILTFAFGLHNSGELTNALLFYSNFNLIFFSSQMDLSSSIRSNLYYIVLLNIVS